MGSGVRVVDLLLYLPTRDTQRTFRLRGPRARVHSLACEQQQERALLAQPVQGVGDLATLATAFMMMGSGFVEVVSRVMLREQTIYELTTFMSSTMTMYSRVLRLTLALKTSRKDSRLRYESLELKGSDGMT
jgi:hypothetical protein